MKTNFDEVEMGMEYGRLVLAAEHGITPYGEPASGNSKREIEIEKAFRENEVYILDQYVEAGGSFLDTANIYARWVPGYVGGESETLLGEWMRERRNRAQTFIATKVGFQYPGVERGLRAHQIEAECEKSLKRLGTETIDLYYATWTTGIHRWKRRWRPSTGW